MENGRSGEARRLTPGKGGLVCEAAVFRWVECWQLEERSLRQLECMPVCFGPLQIPNPVSSCNWLEVSA